MKASIEHLPENSFVVRTHVDGGYGDPYTWACVVTPHGDVAEVKAALRAPTVAERSAVVDALRHRGFTYASWERRKDDTRQVKMYIGGQRDKTGHSKP